MLSTNRWIAVVLVASSSLVSCGRKAARAPKQGSPSTLSAARTELFDALHREMKACEARKEEDSGPPRQRVALAPPERTLGPADAAVTIVAFVDYACPFSRALYRDLEALRKADGGVRVSYRFYPRFGNSKSVELARAACGAAARGQFPAVNDALMTAVAEKKAPQMPAGRSAHCEAELRSDAKYAQYLGVRSTPTIFINGVRYPFAPPKEELARIVADEKTKATELAEQAGRAKTSIYEALTKDAEERGIPAFLTVADL